ncbi:hypothetical protein [Paenibacillus sophorae]|uniref:hypothetical protein n=1 Tax=Paenibacillus sophorae TaxID=1333845 RepID=UPI0004AF4221|nr:hypothetical protein [Paenibacillus sophorae]
MIQRLIDELPFLRVQDRLIPARRVVLVFENSALPAAILYTFPGLVPAAPP